MRKYRKIRLSDAFVAKAQRMFPPGGSTDGRPSYEIFSENVLVAASLRFGRDFESCSPQDGVGVVITAETLFFRRPLAFYARLTDNDEVEMIDLQVDPDWIDWDQELDDDDPR